MHVFSSVSLRFPWRTARLARSLGAFMACGGVACLLAGALSLAGCASPDAGGPPSDQAGQASPDEPAYAVELGDVDGATLLACLRGDPSFSDDASLVDGIQLSVDRDARRVDMTVQAATSDVARMCAIGEEAARCLSDRARVTDENGAPPADDGPCGALYQAYVLSERVQGIGSDDVVDGLLHPGDSDMMWQ